MRLQQMIDFHKGIYLNSVYIIEKVTDWGKESTIYNLKPKALVLPEISFSYVHNKILFSL